MRVRLVHKTLMDGRFHVYTSPDVKGLHVSAETQAAAQRAAMNMLDAIAAELGLEPAIVSFVELADAA